MEPSRRGGLDAPPELARRSGRVADFDVDRGIGHVEPAGGGPALFFHCTAIADGSRTIEPGAAVTFQVVAGQLGRWEARDLRPGPPGS